MAFSIVNLTRRNLPVSELRFSKIKKEILGESYDLSLVFIGKKRSRTLNEKYRQKNSDTNILSFSLDQKNGEIFLTLDKIEKEISKFEMPLDQLVLFLFIHGCLHLKGFEHGEKMEKEETRLLEKFK